MESSGAGTSSSLAPPGQRARRREATLPTSLSRGGMKCIFFPPGLLPLPQLSRRPSHLSPSLGNPPGVRGDPPPSPVPRSARRASAPGVRGTAGLAPSVGEPRIPAHFSDNAEREGGAAPPPTSRPAPGGERAAPAQREAARGGARTMKRARGPPSSPLPPSPPSGPPASVNPFSSPPLQPLRLREALAFLRFLASAPDHSSLTLSCPSPWPPIVGRASSRLPGWWFASTEVCSR